MAAQSTIAHRAEELRTAFDRAFAEPPAAATGSTEVDFLAFRAGPEPYAVRLAEVGGIYANRKIVKLPGGPAAQLGVAGFRSIVMPVLDLSLLLGHQAAGTPRWLMVAAGTPLALAFEVFDGHLRLPPSAIVSRENADGGQSHQHVREFVQMRDAIRPVVQLASVLEAVRRAMSRSDPR
jgi:purine-binding chemotaxis protein CheW